MSSDDHIIDWLLDSDPAIRWQVMRDLLGLPEQTWRAERNKVERHGWGARLFAVQDGDGQWAGGAFVPRDFTAQTWRDEGQPWTATCWTLAQLREFGLEPNCACAQRTVRLIGENSRWEHDGQPYWSGEVEECINGRTVADGAYFGVDVSAIVERLIHERQPDGGWNCERANGSLASSFDTTISVLEGLLEYECRVSPSEQTQGARRSGEEYLLARQLFRRRSTGEPADRKYLEFSYPNYWRYDILRAADYMRRAAKFDGANPDHRLEDTIEIIRAKRQSNGGWLADWAASGRRWFEMDDGVGRPSRWMTLRALRVLKWWDGNR